MLATSVEANHGSQRSGGARRARQCAGGGRGQTLPWHRDRIHSGLEPTGSMRASGIRRRAPRSRLPTRASIRTSARSLLKNMLSISPLTPSARTAHGYGTNRGGEGEQDLGNGGIWVPPPPRNFRPFPCGTRVSRVCRIVQREGLGERVGRIHGVHQPPASGQGYGVNSCGLGADAPSRPDTPFGPQLAAHRTAPVSFRRARRPEPRRRTPGDRPG